MATADSLPSPTSGLSIWPRPVHRRGTDLRALRRKRLHREWNDFVRISCFQAQLSYGYRMIETQNSGKSPQEAWIGYLP